MIPGGLLPIHHRRLLAYDDFSDTDGTLVSTKPLDIGGTWQSPRASGTAPTVVSGRCSLTGLSSIRVCAHSESTVADVIIYCSLKPTSTTDTCSIVARWNGAGYIASSSGSWIEGRLTANGNLLIQQFLNGVSSTLATNNTGVSSAGIERDCMLTVQGNTATFATPIGTVTATINSALANNSKHGWAMANNASTGQSVDNFKVEAL